MLFFSWDRKAVQSLWKMDNPGRKPDRGYKILQTWAKIHLLAGQRPKTSSQIYNGTGQIKAYSCVRLAQLKSRPRSDWESVAGFENWVWQLFYEEERANILAGGDKPLKTCSWSCSETWFCKELTRGELNINAHKMLEFFFSFHSHALLCVGLLHNVSKILWSLW